MQNIYEDMTDEELVAMEDFLGKYDPDFVEFIRLLWVANVIHGDDATFDANVPDLLGMARERGYHPLALLELMKFVGEEMPLMYPEEAMALIRRSLSDGSFFVDSGEPPSYTLH
jgi:hypothetical protein